MSSWRGVPARPGAIASLSQLVLKLTVPGVPDIYQGGELWDFSLVDPDNRRPVDYESRSAMLSEIESGIPREQILSLGGGWSAGQQRRDHPHAWCHHFRLAQPAGGRIGRSR